MRIEYRTGDLLQAAEPVMVHGCNARGSMAAGVAHAIRDRYPAAHAAYRAAHEAGALKLGTIVWAECGRHRVGNAITQERYGSPRGGRRFVDYDAVRAVMRAVNEAVADGTPVAMPLIGAGLAGGSWRTIAKIVEEESTRFRPVVYLLDGIVPET